MLLEFESNNRIKLEMPGNFINCIREMRRELIKLYQLRKIRCRERIPEM